MKEMLYKLDNLVPVYASCHLTSNELLLQHDSTISGSSRHYLQITKKLCGTLNPTLSLIWQLYSDKKMLI